MDEFLELSMHDTEKCFFLSSIFEEKLLFDLIVKHYSLIPKWKKICNNGLIHYRKKKEATNEKIDSNFWFHYKEKYSKKIMSVTYDGIIEVVHKRKAIFSEKIVNQETINKLKECVLLTEEVEKMLKDYLLITEYEGYQRIFHPVRRETFEQRDNVVKIIILFCLLGEGLSAKQLIHIVNIMQEFEMSSKLSYQLFQKAILLEKKEKVLSVLVNKLNDNVKEYTLKDIIYLFELGEVPLEQEERVYHIIQECFHISEKELEEYRYIIKKEYVNG